MRYAFALAALGIVTIAFVFVSLATSGTASAADVPVEAGNLYFCDSAHQDQVCVTNVNVGDTVTWTVVAGSHRIAQCTDNTFSSCTGGFDSGTLQPGGGFATTYQRTFSSAGTTFYVCVFHPSQMKGQIVAAAQVTPTPSPTAAASATPTGGATSTPTSAALPQTGGASGEDAATTWMYGLLAFGAALLAGSALTFALVRKGA